ncbi:hypothetical protein KCP74_14800 [Salmonella enterica subsp. enterica]|nr:hypothetical protein KCP74_14800 [Salmonella enterica subsp. enterica]
MLHPETFCKCRSLYCSQQEGRKMRNYGTRSGIILNGDPLWRRYANSSSQKSLTRAGSGKVAARQ